MLHIVRSMDLLENVYILLFTLPVTTTTTTKYTDDRPTCGDLGSKTSILQPRKKCRLILVH